MSTQATFQQHYNAAHVKELHQSFELVSDPKDWKAPILANLPKTANIHLVCEAAVFFTATTPTVTWNEDGWSIEAIGYRRGPAGDR